MIDCKKRAQVGCIELWISTTWTHWKYAQFRRASDGAVIYDQNRAPLTGGLRDLYARFAETVTPEMSAAIENFDAKKHDRQSPECMAAVVVRKKLASLARVD